VEIEHLESQHQFLIRLPEGAAVLSYTMRGARVMDLESTFVPPAARSRGIGGALVNAALDHARARGWSVIPTCWYVETWIAANPDYRDLIGEQTGS
jgi:predicted GNAT family acetyltransferase